MGTCLSQDKQAPLMVLVVQSRLRHSPLDFRWRDRYSVTFLQNVITGHWLAIDSYQIVTDLFARHLDFEKLLDIRVLGNVDVVGKARAVIVYK
jgi:hypothetical protein